MDDITIKQQEAMVTGLIAAQILNETFDELALVGVLKKVLKMRANDFESEIKKNLNPLISLTYNVDDEVFRLGMESIQSIAKLLVHLQFEDIMILANELQARVNSSHFTTSKIICQSSFSEEFERFVCNNCSYEYTNSFSTIYEIATLKDVINYFESKEVDFEKDLLKKDLKLLDILEDSKITHIEIKNI